MTQPIISDERFKDIPAARLSDRQIEDVSFLRAHPKAAALWHEVGVGKTHPTIMRIFEVLAQSPIGSKVIVLMRRSLFQQWEEKIVSMIKGYGEGLPGIQRLSVGRLQSGKTPDFRPDILLMNYEYVPSLLWEEKGSLMGPLTLLLRHTVLIVADEAQKLKGFRGYRSSKGIRSRLINRMAELVPHKIAMSGSPVINPNSSDVWGLYHFLDPSIFGPTRWKFVSEFFFDVSKDRKYEILKLKPGMAEEMSRRMYLIARRITKKDCPPGEFPTPRRIKYMVELPKAVRKIYDELEEEGISANEHGVITRLMLLDRLMTLQQISSGFFLEDGEVKLLDCSHKMDQLFEIMEEIGDAPMVIWAHFRHEVEYLHKSIQGSVIAYGAMGKELDRNVEAFKSGKANVIVANPGTVGAGMDFQRAQHSIRWSRSFLAEDFEQSDGRVNRAYSQYDETIHHEIIAADTRDEFVYKSLIGKIDLSKTITLDDVLGVMRNA